MSLSHHPLDTRLLDFAAGRIDSGERIVFQAHLEGCSHCRTRVTMLEHVGGVLLDDLPPAPMQPHALEGAMARLDHPPERPLFDNSPLNDMPELPVALRRHVLGPWRWSGPGVRWRSLELSDDSVSRVFLLKAQPGTRLPEHTHVGTELTLVLKGSYSHEGGRFGRGDFEDADGTIEHQPIVGSEGECICLVAMDGNLHLSGVLGRMMQPFVRF